MIICDRCEEHIPQGVGFYQKYWGKAYSLTDKDEIIRFLDNEFQLCHECYTDAPSSRPYDFPEVCRGMWLRLGNPPHAPLKPVPLKELIRC